MQRMTPQRAAIKQLLVNDDSFKTAQQIHELLRRDEFSIGLATVYRNLQTLHENGDVDMVRSSEGEALYRRCGPGSHHHHHHMVCNECGFTIEIEGLGVEEWADKLADKYGFTDVEHTLEIFGTCPECRAKKG